MAQFSRTKFKLKQDVIAVDDAGNANEYRASAFLQFRTEWDDNNRRYKEMTDNQKQICEELHQQLYQAGVEFGISIQYRDPMAGDDLKLMPKIATFSLLCNEPKQKPKPQPEPQVDDDGW
tara:strand:- start:128 stop:487 length:360 start_codon:yes stop_codon:yes gene_type:complete